MYELSNSSIQTAFKRAKLLNKILELEALAKDIHNTKNALREAKSKILNP